MSNRSTYRDILPPSVPFYLQPQWLDAVCGPQGWDVALVEDSTGLSAALPFQIRRKWGLSKMKTPDFSPYSGPWVRPSEKTSGHARISHWQETMEQLIGQFPYVHGSELRFDPNILDASPWTWAGFRLEVRYTYMLSIPANLDELPKVYNRNARRQLEISGLYEKVSPGIAIEFMRQYHPYWVSDWSRTLKDVTEHPIIRIRQWSSGGETRAVAMIAIEGDRGYVINYAVQEGAPLLTFYPLMDAVFREFAGVVKEWDFLGSQQKSIAQSCRSLGGIPTPYFCAVKSVNPWKR